MSDNRKIDENLARMKEEMIRSIQECVQIDSVKGEPEEGAPYGPGPRKALDYALELGKKLGFSAVNVNNRSGYVEFGSGDEMVGVLGHLDVVPVTGTWTYPPFGGELHDGKLWGRGVMDDKGPAIGALYALKAIADAGLPLSRRIRVILGTDEECGSSCVKDYIASRQELPAVGFTPDAEFPLIFSEKGAGNYRLTRKLQDPASNRVRTLQGGTAANVVIEDCFLEAEGGLESCPKGVEISRDGQSSMTRVHAMGKSAHGSRPELGINAAVMMAQVLEREQLGSDFDAFAGFIRDMLGYDTNGTALGIRRFDEETGDTTVNLGLVSFDGSEFSMTLDVRYPRTADADAVRDRIMAAAKRYGMEAERLTSVRNLYVPKDSEVVQKLMKVYRERTGRNEQPLAVGGGTYAKAFKNMVAFGAEFPGENHNTHSPDEFVEVDRLLEAIGLIAAGMYELAR